MTNRDVMVLPDDGRTLLFIDTEFSQLPRDGEGLADWAAQVALLSVGATPLAERAGLPEFYAAARLSLPLLRASSEFVRTQVVPRLDAHPTQLRFSSAAELGQALHGYLENLRDAQGRLPLLAVDWAGDAWLLAPLLGEEVEFLVLDGIPDIRLIQRGIYCTRPRHNALDDACSSRDGFLNYLRRERPRPAMVAD